MNEIIKDIVSNSDLIKAIIVIAGVIIINYVSRFFQNNATKDITDPEKRFRARKIITFIGYFIIMFFVTLVFYKRLGRFTVAFGVIGAGIALALQEVIISFAGWLAISVSNFYEVGDRVLVGGIKGDVIDISFLRTTLMEIGDWVNADLYNGRIVRVANSFVFKAPVFNYSGDFPYVWDEISLPITFNSNHEIATSIFECAGNEITQEFVKDAKNAWEIMRSKYVLEDVGLDPIVTITANDDWVYYTLRYVVFYRKRRITQSKIFNQVLQDIFKSGGIVEIANKAIDITHFPN